MLFHSVFFYVSSTPDIYTLSLHDALPILQEISCMAHARRHFFEVFKAVKSPLAKDAIDRIDVLYDIERDIRGQSAEDRKSTRLNSSHVKISYAVFCLKKKKKTKKNTLAKS